jgi:hypothetical protein
MSASWEFLFLPQTKTTAETKTANNDGDGDDDNFLGVGGGNDDANGNSGATASSSAGAGNANPRDIVFDVPPTWVSPLSFTRTAFNLRYPPNGRRTVQFFKAKVDYFAKNLHSQGMVMRATTYYDETKTIVDEVHEWFENRKDKMYRRIRYFLGERRFVEYFNPGSVGEVKQWLEYPGKRREVEFYINGRLDRYQSFRLHRESYFPLYSSDCSRYFTFIHT